MGSRAVSGKMEIVDLDSIAGKLYGLAPDAFTSSRSAEVRAARSAGNRELAEAVARLRRPTVGAWLANQLARECKGELAALLDLGTAMRKAQEAGDGPALRLLTRQRREMVAGLVSEARRLARTRGQSLSENSTRELENTLEAAVATADAAAALRSGRLTVGLSYSGLGPLDLSAPLNVKSSTRTVPRQRAASGSAQKPMTPPPPSSPSKGPARPAGSKTGRAQPRADWSRLQTDLAAAERTVASAEDVVEETQREASQVHAARDALRGEIVAAERHLRETKKGLEEAERRLVEAKQAEKMAKKELLGAKSLRNKAQTLLGRATAKD